VLLGKVLGSGHIPRIEIPAGVPPEIEAEWRRLAGDSGPGAEGVHASRAPRAPRNGMRKEPPRPEVVQLVRGADGVYRPET
jgi:hypothetical protein